MEIKTIDFKGKKYAEVKERIKFFRNSEKYQNYGIDTHMLEYEAGANVVVKAIIIDVDGRIVATGISNETPNTVMPLMKNSFVEVAETSAIGRALASLGLIGDGEFASYDEVMKVNDFKSDVIDGIKNLNNIEELQEYFISNKDKIELGLKKEFNKIIQIKKKELNNESI